MNTMTKGSAISAGLLKHVIANAIMRIVHRIMMGIRKISFIRAMRKFLIVAPLGIKKRGTDAPLKGDERGV